MFLETLVVITVLCLALPFTRLYGILGAGLLLYLHPFPMIGILSVAGAVFLYYLHRRKSNA